MATYFGSASNPPDDGTAGSGLENASPVAVTPPGSMVSGDLVYMVGMVRSAGQTVAISAAGGQTWTSGTQRSGNGHTSRAFWCVYDGTWDTNPSVSFTSATAMSVVMHVFRPTGGFTWSTTPDVAEALADYAAPGSPFDVTITGFTPPSARTVSLFTWSSMDDNTWAMQGGISNAGNAQYRNDPSGSNICLSFAYIIKTSSSATGNITNRQSSGSGNQGQTKSIAFVETGSAPAPTFDTSPTVTSETATTYTISYEADANADNIYVGAYPKDATAPTGAQLKAGTGAHGTATEATTGSADTINLTPSDNPKFPLYDVYAVLEGAGGFSSVVALVDEFLDPPSGKQFVTLSSVHATSPWNGTSVVAGDVVSIDTLTDPDTFPVTCDVDGTVSYDGGGSQDRQLIDAQVYDVSGATYFAADIIVFNNLPPTPGEEETAFDGPVLYEKDVAISPTIALEPLVTDPEGDSIIVTDEDAMPAGINAVNAGNEIVSGTPTAYGETDVTIRWTDQYNDFYEEDLTIQVGETIPDVVDDSEAAATAALEAIASWTVVIGPSEGHATIVAGNVIRTNPPVGTLVPADQEITLTLSSGTVTFGGTDKTVQGLRRLMIHNPQRFKRQY